MAVVLTLVQIRINIHKQNNTKKHSTNNTKHSKYKYTYYQNTHTLQIPHIHTPTHYKTHTNTHPHITKQVKIATQAAPLRQSRDTLAFVCTFMKIVSHIRRHLPETFQKMSKKFARNLVTFAVETGPISHELFYSQIMC